MSRALIVFFIFILFLDEGSLHHGFGWAEACCTQSTSEGKKEFLPTSSWLCATGFCRFAKSQEQLEPTSLKRSCSPSAHFRRNGDTEEPSLEVHRLSAHDQGNDIYCPACGQHWEVCMDRDHQDVAAQDTHRPLTPSRHSTYRGQTQDASWNWNRRPSQSPRQRQRPSSRRQHGHGGDPQTNVLQKGKGKGKGKGSHGRGKTVPQQAPAQNAHRLGQEGMAPLPPPPLPPQSSFGDAPWTQLAPPFPTANAPCQETHFPSEAESQASKSPGRPQEERNGTSTGSFGSGEGHQAHRRAQHYQEYARRSREPRSCSAILRESFVLLEPRT